MWAIQLGGGREGEKDMIYGMVLGACFGCSVGDYSYEVAGDNLN